MQLKVLFVFLLSVGLVIQSQSPRAVNWTAHSVEQSEQGESTQITVDPRAGQLVQSKRNAHSAEQSEQAESVQIILEPSEEAGQLEPGRRKKVGRWLSNPSQQGAPEFATADIIEHAHMLRERMASTDATAVPAPAPAPAPQLSSLQLALLQGTEEIDAIPAEAQELDEIEIVDSPPRDGGDEMVSFEDIAGTKRSNLDGGGMPKRRGVLMGGNEAVWNVNRLDHQQAPAATDTTVAVHPLTKESLTEHQAQELIHQRARTLELTGKELIELVEKQCGATTKEEQIKAVCNCKIFQAVREFKDEAQSNAHSLRGLELLCGSGTWETKTANDDNDDR